MRWIAFPVALLAAGCSFDSVEDACRKSAKGDQHASPEAGEVMQRISCYRRYAGLDQANIHKRITEATESHTQYLGINGVLEANAGAWWLEDSSQTGFTGDTSYDRLDRVDYVESGEGSMFVWEVLLFPDEAVSRSVMIDEFMSDPFVRDVFLAPAWEGGGYAEGDDDLGRFAYMNIVLYFPSGAKSAKPTVYPVDGQIGVPTTWNNLYTDVAVPTRAGFPVTFTFGSNDTSGGSNPLNVGVTSSVITAPDGSPVSHILLLPGTYESGTNWSTAILVPEAPLQPSSLYTVDASVSWISRTNKDLHFEFTTEGIGGGTTAPVARGAGQIHMRMTELPQRFER